MSQSSTVRRNITFEVLQGADPVVVDPVVVDPVVEDPVVVSKNVTIEAESGQFTLPFTEVNVDGVDALYVVDYSAGTSTYSVDIPADGIYKLGFRVKSPTGSHDSLYFSINGAAKVLYYTGKYTEFTDITYAGADYQLSKGINTLVLTSREKITIDKIYFIGDSNNVIVQEEPAVSDPPTEDPPSTSDPLLNGNGADLNYMVSAPAGSNVSTVTSISALDTKAKAANPGDVIIIKNGTYSTSGSANYSRFGTAAAPIYLLAESKGGVIFTGSRSWVVSGAHWVVSGVTFSATSQGFRLAGNNIRFSGNILKDIKSPLAIYSSNNEIDNNIWSGTIGQSIKHAQPSIDCGSSCKYMKGTHLHHNTFKDIPRLSNNGGEAIMAGYGYGNLPPSYDNSLELIIENNLFDNTRGDPEVISLKSDKNIIRNNCFVNNGWGGLVIRMGSDNMITGNQFSNLNTTGVRISGSRNTIKNNYFEGVGNYAAISFHNTVKSSDTKFLPYGGVAYIAADDNIILDNQFYNFGNFLRDYKASSILKFSENTTVSGNDMFLGSNTHIAQTTRTAAEFEADHKVSNNTFRSSAPAYRASCK